MAENVSKFDSKYLKAKRIARRRQRRRIQVVGFGILLLIIILILLYMFTPLSKVKHVYISGNDNISTKEIRQTVNVTSHSRMYTFSTGKAEKKLEDKTMIKRASVHKQFPNSLAVKVAEYQIVGLVKRKDNYVPILENGKVLDKDDAGEDNGPVLTNFNKEKEKYMISELSKIPKDVRSSISEISYQPEKGNVNQIKLYTSDDIQVLGNIRTIASKMKYYPQMSESLERDESGNLKRSGYIDLTVGAAFVPYSENTSDQSNSEKNVKEGSDHEDKAKDELQNTLNKIDKNKDKGKEKNN
ncbi:FtsQ-type POTRA domain-containing protein [Staphylococcus sp. SQ8-PEA]|uniref:Cell division protein DivIB n=1 Tax=Staphylococcus marylandisciuri TaxID=2981529 RepID=A0ABT2QP09_9STAP|nr:FtsQ-type POTRA domain-containing protein [Staphylococcus marylandisciuri]MCU5745720.1 FtsQ-type POTRA domain-containing protein [Staphylococcus marylandisciuri]